MDYRTASYDLVVVGGGIGGVLTAISAARHGLAVALIDDKTGLGGNANSEIGVAIEGASYFGFFANMREGGLVEELKEALAAVDPFGRNTLNSPVLLFWCQQEGVTVYSELLIHAVESQERRLTTVLGSQGGTERSYRFTAPQFVDATGDGTIAALAGCAYMTGREARSTFNEILAPTEPDHGIMGASVLFRASRKEVPSSFPQPAWAYEYHSAEDLPFRLDPAGRPVEMGFWWIEYAGDGNDPIGEYEAIRQELLKCVFGIWAYYKNHPSQQMAYYALDTVSIAPAKRESRRIVGDYILTEHDIVARTPFSDAVAYAGWNIDIHVPGGFKSPLKPNIHAFFPRVCPLPLRMLYARDLDNLWLVGRDISVSHVALGATRLQATIGAMGHAVGIAAATAHRTGRTTRATAETAIGHIQQTLLKEGAFIPGMRNADPGDHALTASVTATSAQPLQLPAGDARLDVGQGRSLAFPVTEGRLSHLVLPLRNAGEAPAAVHLFLARCDHPNHCTHRRPLAESTFTLAPGSQEVTWDLALDSLPTGLYAVMVMTEGTVQWARAAQDAYGCYTHRYAPDHYCTPTRAIDENLYAVHRPIMMTDDGAPIEWVREYYHRLHVLGRPQDRTQVPLPALQITPAQQPYAATAVTSGMSHTDVMPELWISDASQPLPQALVLQWETPVRLSEVRLVFDTDLDMPQPAVEPIECLVKSYDIAVRTPAGWQTVAREDDNRQRSRTHTFPACETDAVQITVSAMHAGGMSARIFEVRCY